MVEIARFYVDNLNQQYKLSLSNFFLEFKERERLYDNFMKSNYKTKVL